LERAAEFRNKSFAAVEGKIGKTMLFEPSPFNRPKGPGQGQRKMKKKERPRNNRTENTTT